MSPLKGLFKSRQQDTRTPEEKRLQVIKKLSEGKVLGELPRAEIIALLEPLVEANEEKRREVGAAIGRLLGETGLIVLLSPITREVEIGDGSRGKNYHFWEGTPFAQMDYKVADRMESIAVELLGYTKLPNAFPVLRHIVKCRTDPLRNEPLVIGDMRVSLDIPCSGEAEAVRGRALECLAADIGTLLDVTTEAWCSIRRKEWDRVVALLGDAAIEPLTQDGPISDPERIRVMARIGTPTAIGAILDFAQERVSSFSTHSDVFYASLIVAIEALGEYGGQESVDLLNDLRALRPDEQKLVGREVSFEKAIAQALSSLSARLANGE